jgi:hypothetical protein
MPAVQLARLKTETGLLLEKTARPVDFSRALADLFDFYADRVYRPGQTVQPASRIPVYHIPALVIQQLRLEIRPFCRANPTGTLLLFDILWEDLYLEPRQLGAFMLGQVSPEPPVPILDRLENAIRGTQDNLLILTVLDDGAASLRREKTRSWLDRIQIWLNHSDLEFQQAGLQALLPLINDRSFENLPPIFRLISPLLQTAPVPLQPLLQDVMAALVDRSPQEALFFLKQILTIAATPATNRLIRRLLPLFSTSNQASLRLALGAKTGLRLS